MKDPAKLCLFEQVLSLVYIGQLNLQETAQQTRLTCIVKSYPNK